MNQVLSKREPKITKRQREVVELIAAGLSNVEVGSEILRRDIQFLAFPEDDATRRVATLQAEIAACFLSHSYGTAMMIWSDEQRAIGERMIIEEHDKVLWWIALSPTPR